MADDAGARWVRSDDDLRGAILHHDFPERVREDAEFVMAETPVTADYLRAEGLGEAFVKYMSSWGGFVESPASST